MIKKDFLEIKQEIIDIKAEVIEYSPESSCNDVDYNEEEFKTIKTEISDEDDLEASNSSTQDEKRLPPKSKGKYLATYMNFNKWKTMRQFESTTTENVIMIYFNKLAEDKKPSTLWSIYSMLKSTIKTNENIDISTYHQLTAFLKRKNVGFTKKKFKVFAAHEIEKFLVEAPDDQYLAMKVILIFGINGACKGDELTGMTVNLIENHGPNLIQVKFPDTRNKLPSRSFTIVGEMCNFVKKYQALRPRNVSTDRFFLNFQDGKCTVQVIGKHKFGSTPKQIAQYLNLVDADKYTGHSFRRTSATLLTDAGASLTTLKRHLGWKTTAVTEDLDEDSISKKRKIGRMITKSINLATSTENRQNKTSLPNKLIRFKTKVDSNSSTSNDTEETNNAQCARRKPTFQLVNSLLSPCTSPFLSFLTLPMAHFEKLRSRDFLSAAAPN